MPQEPNGKFFPKFQKKILKLKILYLVQRWTLLAASSSAFLTLYMLSYFFVTCCRLLLFFSKLFFSKNSSMNTTCIRVSNGPDLGSNCLQKFID